MDEYLARIGSALSTNDERKVTTMRWFIEDPVPWPAELPFQYGEVVEYLDEFSGAARQGVVVNTATADPELGERMVVAFYDDDVAWVLPTASIASKGAMDLTKAGMRIRPVLAKGSIVVVRRGDSTSLAVTSELWYDASRSEAMGYVVTPIGERDVVFATFADLQLP